jgi:hypothetical protein
MVPLNRVRPFAVLAAVLATVAVVAGLADWMSNAHAWLLLGGALVLAVLSIREV